MKTNYLELLDLSTSTSASLKMVSPKSLIV